jgi:hypothetical protein
MHGDSGRTVFVVDDANQRIETNLRDPVTQRSQPYAVAVAGLLTGTPIDRNSGFVRGVIVVRVGQWCATRSQHTQAKGNASFTPAE